MDASNLFLLRVCLPKAFSHGGQTGVRRETAVPSLLKRSSMMKRFNLQRLFFLTLCCDLGLFGKRLIAPAANILTDALHIPGGIGTGFSLMFLVIASALTPGFGCATVMAAVQSALALSLGMVGSMGLLSPIGYIVPGLVTDAVFLLARRNGKVHKLTMMMANMLSAAAASLTANAIVFHLRGIPLLLYVSVALSSGAVFGLLGAHLVCRLKPILKIERQKKK